MMPIWLSSIKYVAALLISTLSEKVCMQCHRDTDMMDWQNQEGPSPGTLSDDCYETWVDSTEVVVLDAACDWHAIVAALLGGGLTKHMAELRAPVLRTPCHLKGEGGRDNVIQGESSLTAIVIHFTEHEQHWLWKAEELKILLWSPWWQKAFGSF